QDLQLYLRLAAARGDYAEADRLLADAVQHSWQLPSGQTRPGDPCYAAAFTLGRLLQTGAISATGTTLVPVPHPWVPSTFWMLRWRLEAVLYGMTSVQQHAEWHFLRGWLALEEGRCVEARKHFQTVRNITVVGEEWGREVEKVNAWLDLQRELSTLQQLN